MFEGPDDGVQHQFELGGGDGEERREAVRVDGLQQVEEVSSVLGILFKVLKDTTTNALKISCVRFIHSLFANIEPRPSH